jgi:hypothetical protein
VGGGGAGGNGVAVAITGASIYYAGGGGGGAYPGQTGNAPYWGGAGGLGGGGNGGRQYNVDISNGTSNTGGGGGGGCSYTGARPGANGGSGVVILRYPNTFTITIGAGLTGSTSAVSTDKVTTITAGTGNVSFA